MNKKILNTSHCQVKTVKYKGRDYRVQSDKNGFRKSKNKYLNGQKIRIIVDEKFGECLDIRKKTELSNDEININALPIKQKKVIGSTSLHEKFRKGKKL